MILEQDPLSRDNLVIAIGNSVHVIYFSCLSYNNPIQ